MTNTFRTMVALMLMTWLSSQASTAQQPAPAHGQHDRHAPMMSQMVEIHDLFSNHDRMTRSVTNLPNGVWTLTESSDPRVAPDPLLLLTCTIGPTRGSVSRQQRSVRCVSSTSCQTCQSSAR